MALHTLPGRPKVGDRVRVTAFSEDLTEREMVGVVIHATNSALKAKADDGTVFFGPRQNFFLVMTDADLIPRLIQRLQLIAAQDQGLGGTIHHDRAWANARQIALDTLNEIGAG